MNTFRPYVLESGAAPPARPPGSPLTCFHRTWERSRWEWRVGDPGDPAALVEAFLDHHGLPVRDLARPGRRPGPHAAGDVCGAALFVSAAAGAQLAGRPPGAPSPIPVVPDVVAVVYAHRGGPPAGKARPGPPRTVGRARRPFTLGPWRDSWTPAEHAAAVAAVREAIARGDVYQVNLVGHAVAAYSGDPWPALRRVAALPGARHAGILTGPPVPTGALGYGWAIGCASPETLVEVADGRVRTRPIKGTRPATAEGLRELVGSTKERAEHIMIVDLERNDLAQVARTGSVRVDELYAVRRWCALWQAESVVSGALAEGAGLAGLLRAVCPGGSVTGAPKLAALDEISRWEPVGRGPSMGALGWIGPDRVVLGLTIRTVAADAARVHLWAGGGITWGSDPCAEVAEAAAKAAPLRAALAGA